MATKLHVEEWHALAVLAFTLGYDRGWHEQERGAGYQANQQTIDRLARAAMAKSALVGHHVENAALLECWQHNFYRGWRYAEVGSPTTPIYPGYLLYQLRPEKDDWQPARPKERTGARE